MSITLNRKAYEEMIDGDLDWVRRQTHSLEQMHCVQCLTWIRDNYDLMVATKSKENRDKLVEFARSLPYVPDGA